ncbi:MAG: cytochrome c [Hymenobacteraceae bacterium]|nr:cytochrome c [Hymenobacteraceae bacterium]
MKSLKSAALLFLAAMVFYSCSSDNTTNETKEVTGLAHQAPEAPVEDDGKGVGPIKSVEVGDEIDEALAAEGKAIFEGKCSACHQLSDQKVVGPGMAGVTERRKPEWIMNMVINPEEMTKKDPAAKKLLAEHLTQMTNQNINEADARALLEFLRQNDKNS